MQEEFNNAVIRVKTLTEKPADRELLDLYALYKQATEGDNSSKRPGMFDLKGSMKWKQWKSKEGMSNEAAMRSYVNLVDTLLAKYSHS